MVPFHRRAIAAAAVCLLTAASGCFHEPRSRPPEPFEPAAGSDVTEANILDREEMNLSATDMMELLDGRIPGVYLARHRGELSVLIRGQSSVNGSNEALIVVDGVQNSTRSLLMINPADVQRIEVLKGASAAIYGMRGANGVLVVTTRRPGQ